MRAATGRWVIGDDFFNREPELRILENRVREGNHVLLTGQRRMGKTSIARELGRRLAESGAWVTLFTDIEDATCPEDVIAEIAISEGPDFLTREREKAFFPSGRTPANTSFLKRRVGASVDRDSVGSREDCW